MTKKPLFAGKYEVSTGADSSVCISHGKAVVEVRDMNFEWIYEKGCAKERVKQENCVSEISVTRQDYSMLLVFDSYKTTVRHYCLGQECTSKSKARSSNCWVSFCCISN